MTDKLKLGKFLAADIVCSVCNEEINEEVLEGIIQPDEFEKIVKKRKRYMIELTADVECPNYWTNNGTDLTIYPIAQGSEEFIKVQTAFKISPIKALRRV